MPGGTIVLERTERVLANRVLTARTRAERRRGLLALPPLEDGDALVIDRASQVHTFGMAYPIDVVFCARDGTVMHVVRGMRPRRVTKWVRRARYAIELPSGAAGGDLVAGERLLVSVSP